MTTLVICLYLFMFTFMLYRLLLIRKHDKVLYDFCNVRRSMMKYLRDNFETINKRDYVNIRTSLDLLNNSIRHFDHYKHHVFNIKNLAPMLKTAKQNLTQTKKLQESVNPEVKKLVQCYEKSFLLAFFRFTPLLKTKLVLAISLFLLYILLHFANKYCRNWIYTIKSAIEAVKIIRDRQVCYS